MHILLWPFGIENIIEGALPLLPRASGGSIAGGEALEAGAHAGGLVAWAHPWALDVLLVAPKILRDIHQFVVHPEATDGAVVDNAAGVCLEKRKVAKLGKKLNIHRDVVIRVADGFVYKISACSC